MLAPILLFTYNRLSETQQTVEALKANFLAPESELFIFSDGPKNEQGAEKVNEVRQYLKTITGFKTITIFESEQNKGLANSIISGVTQIIRQYEKVIVLEDDLITAPNFLDFLNQALDYYKGNPKIHSISGYTLNLASLKSNTHDYYLGNRASSLGWGTWIEKWQNIDWEVRDYCIFKKNILQQYKFFRIGSDLPKMLKMQRQGKVDSWAIRWVFHQFRNNLVTIFASKSKINHIGISIEATNAAGASRFDTPLDDSLKREFVFSSKLEFDKKLRREFKNRYSVLFRLNSKIRRYILRRER